MDWVTVYDLAADRERVRAMQRVTREPTDSGLSESPALVASPEWWRAIDKGRLPRRQVEGTISRVWWGGMGDFPEFGVVADDGARSTWIREGDASRYAEGLRVRLTYTLHPWKVARTSAGLGPESTIVLRVDLEASDRRSDPRGPGPGAGLPEPGSLPKPGRRRRTGGGQPPGRRRRRRPSS